MQLEIRSVLTAVFQLQCCVVDVFVQRYTGV